MMIRGGASGIRASKSGEGFPENSSSGLRLDGSKLFVHFVLKLGQVFDDER